MNIDNRTVIRIMSVAVVFVLGLAFIKVTAPALTLIFVAFFLALALNPPVTFLASRITKGSRAGATAIAYLFVLLILAGFLWALIPPVVKQASDLVDKLPGYIDDFSSGNSSLAEFVHKYNLDEDVQRFGDEFKSRIGGASGSIFDGINRVGTAIVSVLTVLVLTFFMLVEGPGWVEKFWAIQKQEGIEERKKIAGKMYNVVTGYVNGQILIATIAGLMSLVMMLIVGIPYPLALAGLVSLCGLIPLVGATLGAVIVVAVALFQSLYAAVAMAIFFLIYQQVENNAIQPFIQSRTLEVSPLLVLTAVLLGINVGGLLGGFVAIPFAACARILINHKLEQRRKLKKTPKTA